MRRRKKKRKPSPRVLITGGPTRAYLDRVRYLSNVSSGSLAYEIAKCMKKKGYRVALVAGPTHHDFKGLKLDRFVSVETHDEMLREVLRLGRSFRPSAAVFAAAVLDFAPARVETGKVSSKRNWKLQLQPTRKIIDTVGKEFPEIKRVGFKLEWKKKAASQGFAIAGELIEKKSLQAVCVNFLSEIKGARHPAYLLSRDGHRSKARTKRQIATWIANQVS